MFGLKDTQDDENIHDKWMIYQDQLDANSTITFFEDNMDMIEVHISYLNLLEFSISSKGKIIVSC